MRVSLGRQLIGWALIYCILMSDVAYAMRKGASGLTGEEAVISSRSFSSRRRLVDPNATGDMLDAQVVPGNTLSPINEQGRSDLVVQPLVRQAPVDQSEEQEDKDMSPVAANAVGSLNSKENAPGRVNPDDTQANDPVSAHFTPKEGTAKRFRPDDARLSEVELASSAGQARTSFYQFLETFIIVDLDPETRASLEKIWTIETSWRGTVRWANIDSFLQKCGYAVGVRARNVLMPKSSQEDMLCDPPLWLSGGSLPLLSQNNRRLVYFIDGLRQGTEFVIFRGIHLGITALAIYQLYEWLHQPTSLICHTDTDTKHDLLGLFKFYENSSDNVLLSVFHDVLDPSSPILSYLKYALLTPFLFGLGKGVWKTRKSHMTPEEITEKLENIQNVSPSIYNDLIRWVLPLPPIDLTTGNLMKNLLWNGDLESDDPQRIFDTFAKLAVSGRLYTSIHALGYLSPIVYGSSLNDLRKISQKKAQSKNELTSLLPTEDVTLAVHLQEEGEDREGQGEADQEFSKRIHKRLELKAKALAILEEVASTHDKEGQRKSVSNIGISLYAQYLLWSLGASRSWFEAIGQSLFKGGKLYVQIKFLQTIIDAFLKAKTCPQQPGVSIAGVASWASDLTQACFDANVQTFNIIPGQPTDTLVGDLRKYYFPSCVIDLDLSNKMLSGETVANITRALLAHNITIRLLNLSGNVINNPQDFEVLFSTLGGVTTLDLSSNGITTQKQGVVALADGLANLTQLTNLNLSDNGIGNTEQEIISFAQSLGTLIHLTSLELSNNNIGSTKQGAVAFSQSLRNLTRLTSLDLSDNNIDGEQEIVVLGQSLGNLTRLTSLDLSGNDIGKTGDEGAVALGQSLGNLTRLTSLDLSHNYIDSYGDNGTIALSQSLKNLTRLINLDLSSNSIGEAGDEGAIAIGQSLENLTRLRSLALSGNSIGNTGDEGTIAIGQSLGNLTRLTSLDLSGNDIGDTGDEGVVTLGQSLENLTRLTSLDLSYNYIGNTAQGAVAVGQSLRNLRCLMSLGLSDNNIGMWGNGEVALGQSLGNLTRLTSLDLSGNYIGDTGDEGVVTLGQSLSKLHQLEFFKFLPPGCCYDVSSAVMILNEALNHTLAAQLMPYLSSPEDVKVYCHGLPFSVESVNLTSSILYSGESTLMALMECLSNLTHLTNFDFSGNNIGSTEQMAIVFGKFLGNLTHLRSLNLSNNNIGYTEQGAIALGQSLGNLKYLRNLDLSNNVIGLAWQGAIALGQSLGNLTRLTRLDLSGNEIGGYMEQRAVVLLGQSLGNLTRLTSLDLSGNYIGGFTGQEGIALGQSLGNLTRLTSLDLSGNYIGGFTGQGGIALGQSLGNLTRLTSLDLSDIGITGDNEVIALAHGLSYMQNLEILNLGCLNSLSCNSIGSTGPKGPTALLSVLANLPHLNFSALNVQGMTNVSWTKSANDLQKLRSQAMEEACQVSKCYGGEVQTSTSNDQSSISSSHRQLLTLDDAESEAIASFESNQTLTLSELEYSSPPQTSGASSPFSFLKDVRQGFAKAYQAWQAVAAHPDVQIMSDVFGATQLTVYAMAQTWPLLITTYLAIAS